MRPRQTPPRSHGANRRRYPRLVGPYPGQWHMPDGPVQKGRIGQISLTGCFVGAMQPPEIGRRVIVSIDAADRPALPVAGVVVRARWSDGFGVKFDPLAPEEADAFRALLDALRGRSAW